MDLSFSFLCNSFPHFIPLLFLHLRKTILEMERRITQLRTTLQHRQAIEDAKQQAQELEQECEYEIFFFWKFILLIFFNRNLQKELHDKMDQMEQLKRDEVSVWENVFQRYIQGIGECQKINEQLQRMITETDSSIKMLTKNTQHALKAAGSVKKWPIVPPLKSIQISLQYYASYTRIKQFCCLSPHNSRERTSDCVRVGEPPLFLFRQSSHYILF